MTRHPTIPVPATMILAFVFIAGCASPVRVADSTSEGTLVEQAILWEAKLDETWTPVELSKLLEDPELFDKEGNFYRAKAPLAVFGHPAVYVGMLGIEMIPGPNVTLRGSPKEIAGNITAQYGLTFSREDDAYVCNYKENVQVVVLPHPDKRDQTIVIGAYTGP
jgi:hypothetical protein